MLDKEVRTQLVDAERWLETSVVDANNLPKNVPRYRFRYEWWRFLLAMVRAALRSELRTELRIGPGAGLWLATWSKDGGWAPIPQGGRPAGRLAEQAFAAAQFAAWAGRKGERGYVREAVRLADGAVEEARETLRSAEAGSSEDKQEARDTLAYCEDRARVARSWAK